MNNIQKNQSSVSNVEEIVLNIVKDKFKGKDINIQNEVEIQDITSILNKYITRLELKSSQSKLA
jgi:hypothetical protein